ncbi:MAG: hypothetical protein NZ891_05760, partial [bacterium]|nr:hypothetical protein [bacterium]MDW8164230.1 hypothetical protein [Candidatus Omnitrophota bacterium]
MIIFSGNELSIGIILTNWLIFEGLGSYIVGKKSNIFLKENENFSILTLVFGLYIPFSIYLVRILKKIVGLSIAQPVSIFQIFYSSFFILSIPSFIHGALFTFSCKIYSELIDKKEKSPAITYIYETTGTILGGVIWTYILIRYFHSFKISLLISSINFLISIGIIFYFSRKIGFITKIIKILSILLFLLSIYAISTKLSDKFQKITISKQWSGVNIINYKNSIYGNICVSENEGQYTFFLNGVPHFVIPVPDIIYVEEFVHLPASLHPNPEKVLIISGNFEMIKEILKYETVKSIEYLEIDPLLIEIIKKLPPNLIEVLNDKKVKIINEDGRFYMNKTKEKYDLIFIGISDLTNLQSNRFFTKEFFTIVKNKLNEKGILIFGIYGSLTYLTEELKKLHKCIYETLSLVFNNPFSSNKIPKVRAFPGTGTFLYLASKNGEFLWTEKIENKEYKNQTIYLDYILHPGWFKLYIDQIVDLKYIDINRDFKPIGLFYSLSYWNTIFASYLRPFFKIVEVLSRNIFILFILLSMLILINLTTSKKMNTSFYKFIPFSIFTTGFSGMIFNLLVIFMFQIIYGFIFYWIGILTTSFMVGLIFGSRFSILTLKKFEKIKRIFITTEISIILYSLTLFIILKFIQKPTFPIFLFLFFSFLNGFLVGVQFPI